MSYDETIIHHTGILTPVFNHCVFRRCWCCGDRYASVAVLVAKEGDRKNLFEFNATREWQYYCQPCHTKFRRRNES